MKMTINVDDDDNNDDDDIDDDDGYTVANDGALRCDDVTDGGCITMMISVCVAEYEWSEWGPCLPCHSSQGIRNRTRLVPEPHPVPTSNTIPVINT